MNKSALLYSGGYGHPFEHSSPALARIADEAGWKTRIEENLDSVLAALPHTGLLLVNALYWSMTQHEKYAADRARWAFEMGDDQIAAIDCFVAGGGQLFVLHTGTICWDNQPLWREIMGGGWRWGRSRHPPLGSVEIVLTAKGASLSAGAARFRIDDEVYHDLDPAPTTQILATSGPGEASQPVAWLRKYGKGCVAVDALGHDARSLSAFGHEAMILSMLRWLGEKEGEANAAS